MLVKESNDRINFIDKFDNFVGFDWVPKCCEQFDWYASKKKQTDKVGSGKPNLDGFWFDTSHPPVNDFARGPKCTEIIAFRLINDKKKIMWLHLCNTQSGYYSHGWEASWGHSGSI